MLNSGKAKGFTLIELMIVVVVIAVLAGIALPSYKEQAQRGRRADGKAFIMDIASRQERFYTQYASYTGSMTGGSGCSGVACNLNYDNLLSPDSLYEAELEVAPSGCSPDLTSGNPPCSRYTITINPNFDDPRCGKLTLDNTGQKGKSGPGTVEECWR